MTNRKWYRGNKKLEKLYPDSDITKDNEWYRPQPWWMARLDEWLDHLDNDKRNRKKAFDKIWEEISAKWE